MSKAYYKGWSKKRLKEEIASLGESLTNYGNDLTASSFRGNALKEELLKCQKELADSLASEEVSADKVSSLNKEVEYSQDQVRNVSSWLDATRRGEHKAYLLAESLKSDLEKETKRVAGLTHYVSNHEETIRAMSRNLRILHKEKAAWRVSAFGLGSSYAGSEERVKEKQDAYDGGYVRDGSARIIDLQERDVRSQKAIGDMGKEIASLERALLLAKEDIACVLSTYKGVIPRIMDGEIPDQLREMEGRFARVWGIDVASGESKDWREKMSSVDERLESLETVAPKGTPMQDLHSVMKVNEALSRKLENALGGAASSVNDSTRARTARIGDMSVKISSIGSVAAFEDALKVIVHLDDGFCVIESLDDIEGVRSRARQLRNMLKMFKEEGGKE